MNDLETHEVQFWTDSFHEGVWAAEQLASRWRLVERDFLVGFVPTYVFEIRPDERLRVTVYGSYESWSPLPDKIQDLLGWGKPDIVVYDVKTDKIILALEETAAVPTGNQGAQRCERLFGAARAKIPFGFLLGEFGQHLDGNSRRDSIWATLQALKLTLIEATCSIVAHYGERDSPDAYHLGTGRTAIFRLVALLTEQHFGENVASEVHKLLIVLYQEMLDFVQSQRAKITNFLPGSELLVLGGVADLFAQRSQGSATDPALAPFGQWPLAAATPSGVWRDSANIGFRVPDLFLEEIHRLIDRRRAYTLTNRSGSKPQPREDIARNIERQRTLYGSDRNLPNAQFGLHLGLFPASSESLHHVSTSLRTNYLIDSIEELFGAANLGFPRRANLAAIDRDAPDMPAFLFVCNSLTPGRMFGDPYTGQLAQLAPIFCRDVTGRRNRAFVAYYPHQSHTQLTHAWDTTNKGIQILTECVDYAIFHSGVIVDVKNRTWA